MWTNYVLFVINFLLLGIIYVAFFFRSWLQKGFGQFMIRTIMYAYICLVIMVTLMPFGIMNFIPGGNSLFLDSANFEPYRDVLAGYGGAVRESILNVIMLMPFGFLLPLIKKTKAWKVLCLTFFFSLSIELTQLYFAWSGGIIMRSFDVTDLINNSLGGLIGYFIYSIFRTIVLFIFRRPVK